MTQANEALPLAVILLGHGAACLWTSRYIHPEYPKWTAKLLVVIGVIELASAVATAAWIVIGGAK